MRCSKRRQVLAFTLFEVMIALGIFFFALAGLRYMQSHRFFGQHLTGNWSWVPYMIVFVFALAIAVLFALRITKGDDRG